MSSPAVRHTSFLARPFAALIRQRMGSQRLKRRAFRGYAPTPHDIFICTYAKSGTNWAMQIAYQISTLGGGEFGHIHDVVPWPEGPPYSRAHLSDPLPTPTPTGLRVIKTHLESSYVPYNRDAKYLVVIRDPAEVVVSAYFFWNGLVPGFARFTPEAWCRLFSENKLPLGSWAEHLASYWPWRERDNVLFLSYSEMKADLEGTVGRVADFMEVQLTDEALANITEKSTFAYMKRIDHQFVPPLPKITRRLGGGEVVMMRKGQKGAAGELLTVEQEQEVRRSAQRDLKRRGSDFPFAEVFTAT